MLILSRRRQRRHLGHAGAPRNLAATPISTSETNLTWIDNSKKHAKAQIDLAQADLSIYLRGKVDFLQQEFCYSACHFLAWRFAQAAPRLTTRIGLGEITLSPSVGYLACSFCCSPFARRPTRSQPV